MLQDQRREQITIKLIELKFGRQPKINFLIMNEVNWMSLMNVQKWIDNVKSGSQTIESIEREHELHDTYIYLISDWVAIYTVYGI